jgi:hypothetical protein
MKCKVCGAWLNDGAMFCGECGSSVLAASATSDTQRIERLTEAGAPGGPGAAPWTAAGAEPLPVPPAQTFTLVFSTGEEVQASGAGLIGRNPIPAADEPERQIVRIVDSQLSVSKTHLEFGEESGNFWVCDRNSGNGSVIFVEGQEPRVAVPGERYAVPRGTRISIGEQYFDVR